MIPWISRIFQFVPSLDRRWSGEGGYQEFLRLAFPLILSTSAWSLQNFVDRMFLTWYSPAAIAAAMPAGMLNTTLMSLFLGTVGYVDVFAAQYYGASRRSAIGPVIWQGIYLSLAGALIMLALAPFSHAIFALIGHAPDVRQNEEVFFRILCLGSFPALASAAMSGFFAGRGQTWTLVWVNALGTLVNLIFDYLLIFGHGGFPEWGMKGAAVATVLSGVTTFLMYGILLARSSFNRDFHTLRGWRLNRKLLVRIVHFGFPNGLQNFLDIAGLTLFILILGILGTASLAATNIAFNINTIAFMPMLGGGIAVSVLVGQYLGRDRPDLAERSANSAFHLCFLYMASISALFVLLPNMFIHPFSAHADPGGFGALKETVVMLLRFVAVYTLFDTLNIIFASALKGAGDTYFVMRNIVAISLLVLLIPSYIALVWLHQGLYTGWTIASVYVIVLALAFWVRFRQGKWKSMRVMEEKPVLLMAASIPEMTDKE